MNRINQLFLTKHSPVLSIYFCAGTSHVEGTADVIRALQQRGVDMVEIGIPFSDPMADGPVIQEASSRALRNGMTLRKLFAQLTDIRRDVHIPLLLMGYLNPIMQYGFEHFCRDCQACGIDGAIIPDLPFADYLNEYRPVAEAYGIKLVMLITPETSEERIRRIDRYTDGFIYMVSSAATTGAQTAFDEERREYFRRIKAMRLRNPLLVGFGISNRQTYEAATAHAAGCIVGSKFVKLLEEHGGDASLAMDALWEALRND